MPSRFPEEMAGFTSFQSYRYTMDRVPQDRRIWLCTSAPQHPRIAVMGFDNREPTRDELEQMKAHLGGGYGSRGHGPSTGLIYTPCCYAKLRRIVELAS